jgi:hypothetical protein
MELLAAADHARIPRSVSVPCFVAGVLLLLGSFTLNQLLDYSSWEFMHFNIFGVLSGVLGTVVLSVVMLLPFLAIKATIARRSASRTRAAAWLLSPALVMSAFIVVATLLKCRPERRLEMVAGIPVERARNIRSAGLHSFNAGCWLVVCNADEASFADYCVRRKLVFDENANLLDHLRNRSLVRISRLVAAITDFADPFQFSRIEGENQRFGAFAVYDRASGTMVIYRYFHD